MSKIYGFIVDTDSYSGNFEREMCAYMTGHIGECEVGEKESQDYLEDFKLMENVLQQSDERGCYRPVEAWSTPGVYNNGLGFDYVDGEEELAIQKYIEYKTKEDLTWIERYEDYKKTLPHDWTIESLNAAQDKRRADIETYKNITSVGKYSAYHSVLIYFNQPPTIDQIALLKNRAREFKSKYLGKVIGFRLMEKEVVETMTYTDI